MSSGLIVFGNEVGAYYSKKQWSGTNGKYIDPPINRQEKMNPYTMNYREAHQKISQQGQYMGVSWGPQNVSWTNNDSIQALGNLADKVRGHSFNLGVAAAEAPQSVKLVVDTVVRFTKAIGQLKRGRFDLAVRALGVSPRRLGGGESVRKYHSNSFPTGPRGRKISSPQQLTSKDVSSMWLEIQYGWKPLLNDVYESQKAFVTRTAQPRRYVFRTSVFRNWKPYEYTANLYANWYITSSTNRQIKAILTEVVSMSRALGLTNPASVVWEKVPFSFVADWFIPIGTYLDALNIVPTLVGYYAVTDITRSNTTGYGKRSPYDGALTTASTVSMTRTISTSLEVPRPNFKPIDSAMSSGHIKNAVALLHQMLK